MEYLLSYNEYGKISLRIKKRLEATDEKWLSDHRENFQEIAKS